MKLNLAILGLVIVILLAPIFTRQESIGTPAASQFLPWQISLLENGETRVFGLTPGRSPLVRVQSTFNEKPRIAIIGVRDQAASIEAYFENLQLDFITGKMVITADLAPATVEAMRQRAPKTEILESSTRRASLSPADLDTALQAPIRAIAFIPSVSLDADTIIKRFGEPAERVRSSDTVEHFLYPAKGLDITVDSAGKELLQYVAPARFALLRDPLLTSLKKPS